MTADQIARWKQAVAALHRGQRGGRGRGRRTGLAAVSGAGRIRIPAPAATGATMTDRDGREHDGSSEDWLVELTEEELAQLEVHGAIAWGRSAPSVSSFGEQ